MTIADREGGGVEFDSQGIKWRATPPQHHPINRGIGGDNDAHDVKARRSQEAERTSPPFGAGPFIFGRDSEWFKQLLSATA